MMPSKRLTPVARRLRWARTDTEQRLWQCLRARQLENAKFVFQFPIGPYVADFACRAAHLVVEVDGGQHGPEVDAARTRALEEFGYHVIRFWNHDVLQVTDAVIETIRQELLLGFNREDE